MQKHGAFFFRERGDSMSVRHRASPQRRGGELINLRTWKSRPSSLVQRMRALRALLAGMTSAVLRRGARARSAERLCLGLRPRRPELTKYVG